MFAKAFAKACIKGEGTSTAVQTTFARAVIKPLATISINAVAEVDCRGSKYSLSVHIEPSFVVQPRDTLRQTSKQSQGQQARRQRRNPHPRRRLQEQEPPRQKALQERAQDSWTSASANTVTVAAFVGLMVSASVLELESEAPRRKAIV